MSALDSGMLDEALTLLGPAIAVFLLHLVAVVFMTLRVLLTTRGYEVQAATAAFFEAFAYILAIGLVVENLDAVASVIAYGLGFAAGTILGLRVEQRLAFGYVTIHVFSRPDGERVASAVRDAGFAATVQTGRGRSGPVGVVVTVVPRKDALDVTRLIRQTDPEAFVSTDDTRGVIRGWFGMPARVLR